MIGYIIKLLKALGSNSKPSQIANSFCIGLILGLMPKNNLLWWLVFIFFMFVRINKAGYFIMMILGSFVSPYIDPIFHQIGEKVLTYEPLVPTFAKLLEIPLLDLLDLIIQSYAVHLLQDLSLTFHFFFLCFCLFGFGENGLHLFSINLKL
ncbi:MAG: TIGR03546 family protein [Spirochaetaceae bacterium]|nr:TIGR03546 family protein [Spirochaetaceae bacterium]